jgi:cell division protein DivIC
MRLIESLKKKKFLLFNIFFTLYIGINFIGGERGLISYFDKKNTYEELVEKDKKLTIELKDLDHKISLINKNDPDYLDMLYREKFNYVTGDEIIIKLKGVKKLGTQKK